MEAFKEVGRRLCCTTGLNQGLFPFFSPCHNVGKQAPMFAPISIILIIFMYFMNNISPCLPLGCSAGCGAGPSCQICSVISQLSKAGKSIVGVGWGWGWGGISKGAGFKMCSVSLNSTGGFWGGLVPLWHMQQRHNELYYNYKAQSVEVDNIDIWLGRAGGGGWSVLLHRDRATPEPISIQITLT